MQVLYTAEACVCAYRIDLGLHLIWVYSHITKPLNKNTGNNVGGEHRPSFCILMVRLSSRSINMLIKDFDSYRDCTQDCNTYL